mmetsp:Transcript_18872/g.42280  ORF Transcript_18872/g.42280 Transcript_18872/m.42280 type:complete len:85 (-) Transcript_18872:600-854(-)
MHDSVLLSSCLSFRSMLLYAHFSVTHAPGDETQGNVGHAQQQKPKLAYDRKSRCKGLISRVLIGKHLGGNASKKQWADLGEAWH